MALCLCRFLSYTFPRPTPSQRLFFHSTNLPSSYCPKRFCKFTALPFPCHKRFKASFCALSSPSSASMENPPEGYRRNVGICLMNPSSKKIFAASRLDVPGSWQMPQGGIDESEDPRKAAIRELREETGVTSADIVAEIEEKVELGTVRRIIVLEFVCNVVQSERMTWSQKEKVPYWLTYDFPPEVRENLKQQWGEDWKGQAQKWYLFKFNGNEDEINLLGDGTEKAEFGEWAWMSPEQLVDHVVDFKKPVYKEAFSAFAPYFQ